MPFNFNPQFLKENQISSDTVGASANVGRAYGNIADVLRGYSGQLNIQDAAKAKVNAANVANERDVLSKLLGREHQTGLATQANVDRLGLERLKAINARNAATKKSETDIDTATQANTDALHMQDVNLENQMKLEKFRKKINPTKAPFSQKDVSKEIKSQGGLTSMMDKAFADIEGSNKILDVNYSVDAKDNIRGGLMSVLQSNPQLQSEFMTSPSDFVKMFVETMGKTDESYIPFQIPGFDNKPFGADEWTPDTNSDSIRLLEERLKSLRKGK